MRLWFFDFDGIVSTDGLNYSTTQLDSACDAILRRLADSTLDQVVIVSDRNIFDIADRISIPGVIIGGCNGIEWQLPSGYRVGPFKEHEDDLIRCRLKILPELSKIVTGAGIELDDKLWSIAVDTSGLKYNDWIVLENKICAWSEKHSLTVNCGIDQIDIQLISGFNKSVGISFLARMFDLDPEKDSVVYAGAGESDTVAIWWTIFFGGASVMVGEDLCVPGAEYVKDSTDLAKMIENMVVNS